MYKADPTEVFQCILFQVALHSSGVFCASILFWHSKCIILYHSFSVIKASIFPCWKAHTTSATVVAFIKVQCWNSICTVWDCLGSSKFRTVCKEKKNPLPPCDCSYFLLYQGESLPFLLSKSKNPTATGSTRACKTADLEILQFTHQNHTFKSRKNSNYFVWMASEFSVWTFSFKLLWNLRKELMQLVGMLFENTFRCQTILAEFEWNKFKFDGVSCGALQKILTTFTLYKCKLLFQSISLHHTAPVALTELSVL